MAKYYTTSRLSKSIWETPEGFLVCGGVAITRTGDLEYRAEEMPGVKAADGVVVLTRTEEDVFDPLAIASFEGKPVTINHPSGFVDPDNWRDLAVGTIQNVRRGKGDESGKLLADLLITDAEAIAAIRSGELREVSCGYEFELFETRPGAGAQKKIRGNHVALVESGRAGQECRIQDSKPIKGTSKMNLAKLLRRAADEMPDDDETEKKEGRDEEMDVAATLKAIMARLDKLEGKAAGDSQEDPEDPEDPDKAKDETGEATDPDKDRKASDSRAAKALDARLDMIEAGLARLLETQVTVKYSAADTARAEILAPGIAHTADMKKRAIKAAYATADGKAVIDGLLDGQSLDRTTSFDGLFLAAAAVLEKERSGQLPQAGRATDAFSGPMTPERLTEINRKHFERAA